jgi:hypothetical protein
MSGSLTCSLILFPFILFEMLRIQSWSTIYAARDSFVKETARRHRRTLAIDRI